MGDRLDAQRFYRKLYKDILSGYSILDLDGQKVFVKHLSDYNLGELEHTREEHLLHAQGKNLPLEEEKLKTLIEQEHWELAKENKISKLQQDLAHAKQTLDHLVLQSQKTPWETQIKNKSKALEEILTEKEEVMGMTAEKYADKRANEESIRLSLYKDEKLTEHYFTAEDYEDIPDDNFVKIVTLYNKKLSDFNSLNLKKLSALPFFLNPFTLCKDNPYVFFRKSVIELTHYQSEIFFNGLTFKGILSQGKSPPEMYYTDLDKLVQWYTSQQKGGTVSDGEGASASAPERREKWGKDATAIVGASTEETQAFASQHGGEVVDLYAETQRRLEKKREELKKEGKDPSKAKLSTEDFLEIHGI